MANSPSTMEFEKVIQVSFRRISLASEFCPIKICTYAKKPLELVDIQAQINKEKL